MKDAAYHIANNPGKYRPGMTNHYNLIIPGLEGILDKTSEEDGAVLGDDASLVLKISNETFVEPTLSQQSIPIKRGNVTIEYPGVMDSFSSDSTFTCFIDADTYGKLYAWKCQSGDHETGDIGDPQDYWKTVTIEHTTGKGDLIGTWTLNNCWLAKLAGVTFSNTSSEIKTVSVTLKYFKPVWRKA